MRSCVYSFIAIASYCRTSRLPYRCGMAILDYAGTTLALATVPLVATLIVVIKLVAFIPTLVKWSKDEETSSAKGVQVPQDEKKVAEFNGEL